MIKKIFFVFIFAFFLLFGVMIAQDNSTPKAEDIQNQIDRFENEITTPNKTPSNDAQWIEPNITNQVAKKGEQMVHSVLKRFLEKVKGLLES